jgi:hypothetical protein
MRHPLGEPGRGPGEHRQREVRVLESAISSTSTARGTAPAASVLRIVGVTEEPQRQPVHRLLDLADQCRQRFPVAIGGPAGQPVDRRIVAAPVHHTEVWTISPRSGSPTSLSRSCILVTASNSAARCISRCSASARLQVSTSSHVSSSNRTSSARSSAGHSRWASAMAAGRISSSVATDPAGRGHGRLAGTRPSGGLSSRSAARVAAQMMRDHAHPDCD